MLFNKLNVVCGGCVIGRGAEFGPRFVLIHSQGVVINAAVRGGARYGALGRRSSEQCGHGEYDVHEHEREAVHSGAVGPVREGQHDDADRAFERGGAVETVRDGVLRRRQHLGGADDVA